MKRDSIWDETVDRPFIGKIERYGRKLIYRLSTLFIKSPSVSRISLKDVRRLLIIKEPYRMGDLMQITPLLRALRKNFPALHIGLVVQDRNKPIFETNRNVNDLFLFEKRKFNSNPFMFVEFMKRIRAKCFDLAVTLETQRTHLTNDLIAYYSGASLRMRYDGNAFGFPESNIFYNLLVPFDFSAVHEVDKNFGVFKYFGLELENRSLFLDIPEKNIESAIKIVKAILAAYRIPLAASFTIIHPGAYKINNRWPLKNYIEVAKKLKEHGETVLFILGPSESGWEQNIVKEGFPVVSNISLLELGGILKLSKTVLCNDTGIMHIASAVGAKTVALFGETDPLQWKPPGEHVRVIQRPDKRIEKIELQEVFKTLIGNGS